MASPGSIATLPQALQERLGPALAQGMINQFDLDPKVIQDLSTMPENQGIMCIDRFLASNLFQIRNKSAFMVGVINRSKTEVAAGVAVPMPSMMPPPGTGAPAPGMMPVMAPR